MAAEVRVGPGLEADDGVVVGYRPGRDVDGSLVLGPGARLRQGTIIYGGSTIGARFETGHHVVVREECVIGDDTVIWSNSVVDYGCTLGRGVKIHAGCYVAQFSRIGDGAFLAPGVCFANDLYPGNEASAAAIGGPVVGAGAQLGINVTVLPYVRIGDGAIVGAGSVVTRDVPAGMVAYGNPARALRYVGELTDIGDRVAARQR